MKSCTKHFFALLIFTLILTAKNPAQINNVWTNLTGNNNHVSSLALEDSLLWAGTFGELVKFNLKTGIKEFFNASNSGLSVNFVQSIFIDHNKNKWFATHNGGLIKYDGSKWTLFHENNSGLPDNFINSIAEDKKGNIWIATMYGGIARYDGSTFQVFTKKEIGNYAGSLEHINFDSNNTLWGFTALSNPGILVRYDGNKWKVFDTRYLESNFGAFKSLAIDTANVIWLATEYGLVSFADTVWQLHSRPGLQNAQEKLTTVYIDSSNNIWTASEHGGIYKYDRNNWTVYGPASYNLANGYIHQILSTNNKIYAADWDKGLIYYDGEIWFKYDLTNTKFPSNGVNAIAIDKNNNAWVETYGNLIKFDGLNFTIFSDSIFSIHGYNINEMNFDSHNNLWLTLYSETNSALGKYDGNSLQIFEKGSPVSGVWIHKVILDNNDVIWATTGSELVRYDGKWTAFDKDNSGLPANDIRRIAIDSRNNKWIATGSGGLVKYDGSSWTVYNSSNSQIGSDSLYNVAVDNNDDIWIANTKGLLQFHNPNSNPEWHFVRSYQKDIFYSFSNMLFGENNELYIAGYGITKFSGDTFTRYDIFNSGIPYNNITAFAIDKNNNKWIGGAEGGLAIFNESGFTTSVTDLSRKAVINDFELLQNYPNPFNPVTTISYSVPQKSFVELKIYDVLGREVTTLVKKEQGAGEYKVQLNGSSLPSGVYIYTIASGQYRDSKKMVLLK